MIERGSGLRSRTVNVLAFMAFASNMLLTSFRILTDVSSLIAGNVSAA